MGGADGSVLADGRAVCADYAALAYVITQACDGRVQAPMVLRTVLKGLLPVIRAVSTTVRMAVSPSAAHMAR